MGTLRKTNRKFLSSQFRKKGDVCYLILIFLIHTYFLSKFPFFSYIYIRNRWQTWQRQIILESSHLVVHYLLIHSWVFLAWFKVIVYLFTSSWGLLTHHVCQVEVWGKLHWSNSSHSGILNKLTRVLTSKKRDSIRTISLEFKLRIIWHKWISVNESGIISLKGS